MSTSYTGVLANITEPLAATIVGATNAAPIVVETSTAHLYGTGDRVVITGVLGNLAANSGVSPWVITVIDAVHFSLAGSTGTGTYTSGGTVHSHSLTPQFLIPSDGDAFTAAIFGGDAFKALADRTQHIKKVIDNNMGRSISFAIHSSSFLTSAAMGKSQDLSATALSLVTTAAPNATRYDLFGGYLAFYDVVSHAAGKHIWCRISEFLETGAILTSSSLVVTAAGAHGALPLVMPAYAVVRHEPLSNTIVGLYSGGMTDDPSATTAAYQAIHGIPVTFNQYNTIDLANYVYYVVICNEGDTNSLAGLKVHDLILNMIGGV